MMAIAALIIGIIVFLLTLISIAKALRMLNRLVAMGVDRLEDIHRLHRIAIESFEQESELRHKDVIEQWRVQLGGLHDQLEPLPKAFETLAGSVVNAVEKAAGETSELVSAVKAYHAERFPNDHMY